MHSEHAQRPFEAFEQLLAQPQIPALQRKDFQAMVTVLLCRVLWTALVPLASLQPATTASAARHIIQHSGKGWNKVYCAWLAYSGQRVVLAHKD